MDRPSKYKICWAATKQIPESDRAHQSAAGSAHERGNTPAKPNHDLADLVWKYFAEEITEAVIEVQDAFPPEQGRLKKAGK